MAQTLAPARPVLRPPRPSARLVPCRPVAVTRPHRSPASHPPLPPLCPGTDRLPHGHAAFPPQRFVGTVLLPACPGCNFSLHRDVKRLLEQRLLLPSLSRNNRELNIRAVRGVIHAAALGRMFTKLFLLDPGPKRNPGEADVPLSHTYAASLSLFWLLNITNSQMS